MYINLKFEIMRIRFWVYPLIIMEVLLVSLICCKKEDSNSILPVLYTSNASSVTQTTAQIGGMVFSEGEATVIARGVCWSTKKMPSVTDNKTINGTGAGSFTSTLTGLTANTTYYVRAYATNSEGTGYGEVMSFETLPATIPELTTNTISNIVATTAQCGGTITSDGGTTITACGVCWDTVQTPTMADNITIEGTGLGSFTSSLTGLTAYTIYYVRAYATNNVGTGYGNILSFTAGNVTDIDGNVYQVVSIGKQLWIKENLKTTHYRDGSAIPNVTVNSAWVALTTGAYCWYNNDEATYKNTYGALYNWYAVADSRNLCPTGWHIPTYAENGLP